MSEPTITVDGMTFTFRRGFVASVALPCAAWLRHGPALVAAAPLEQVRLSDREPLEVEGWGLVVWHQQPPDDAASVPGPIFRLLRGGKTINDGRRYESRGEAEADISAACLALARSAVSPTAVG